jgi:hypothetical protein
MKNVMLFWAGMAIASLLAGCRWQREENPVPKQGERHLHNAGDVRQPSSRVLVSAHLQTETVERKGDEERALGICAIPEGIWQSACSGDVSPTEYPERITRCIWEGRLADRHRFAFYLDVTNRLLYVIGSADPVRDFVARFDKMAEVNVRSGITPWRGASVVP